MIGRGVIGAGASIAGNALGDAVGGDAGDTIGRASNAFGMVAPFSLPAAAAAGVGVAAGDTIGRALTGNDLGDVVANVSRRFGGSESVNIGALMDAGVAGPAGIVELMRTEGGDHHLASILADAGVEGAVRTDDGVSLSGDALDLVNGLGAATIGEGGELNVFLRELRDSDLQGDEINDAFAVYAQVLEDGEDSEGAASVTFQVMEEARQSEAAEEELFAQQMAFQEQARRYIAPVVGQMRLNADSHADYMMAHMDWVPPELRNAFAAEIESRRAGIVQQADAYEAQIALMPAAAYQEQQSAAVQGIAAQIQQAAVQNQLNAFYAPAAQEGFIDPALAG